MIWSVDLDDFRGTCTGEPYPLLTSIKEELKGYQVQGLEAASSNAYGTLGQALGKIVLCNPTSQDEAN